MTYTNREISEILAEIGEMLDLQGGNPFRVRAYERAADTVLYHAKELADIYEEGGLKALEEMEGIGEAIGKKIERLLTTGTLKYYENLKKKVPAAERQLLDIPGVGPKTARKLYDTLKPTSVKDLVAKLKAGEGDGSFGKKNDRQYPSRD